MAKILRSAEADVIALFRQEDFDSVLSLLYEFQDPDRGREIVNTMGFELSSTQIARLSVLWRELTTQVMS